MKTIRILLLGAIFLSFISTSCSQENNKPAQIAWDKWGVPHISADNIHDLFYAQGWKRYPYLHTRL